MPGGAGPVGQGELVVPGGQGAPLLDAFEAVLDDVTFGVRGGAGLGWASSPGPAAFAVGLLGRVCSIQQPAQDTVPGAVPGKAAVACPNRLAGPELTGQVPLGEHGPVPVDDPLHHRAVIRKTSTSLAIRGRDERLDQFPVGIRKRPHPRHAVQNRGSPPT